LGIIKNIYIDEPENYTRIKITGISCDRDILINTSDRSKIERSDWTIQKHMGKPYAVPFNFESGYEGYKMGNIILEIRPSGRLSIKYKNKDTLDNRRENLIVEAKSLLYNEGGKVFVLDLHIELDNEKNWAICVFVQGNEYNYTEDSKEYNIEEAYMRAIKRIKFQL
jgi:hypothetical protein